uniref:Uncharacterized protein n=1 Tax=Siphoviridae sp. ct5op20 TaxID=2826295 RepID=A0A8S5NRB3_9CAUD|nr:MAG TPA: hypothetical protein [Siphoviridae sp. ct5op20]
MKNMQKVLHFYQIKFKFYLPISFKKGKQHKRLLSFFYSSIPSADSSKTQFFFEHLSIEGLFSHFIF